MNIQKKETTHFNARPEGAKPSFIIIHYTETPDMALADGYFTGAIERPDKQRVSAHYMIDRDGSVIQYVDDEKRAWHAGVSHWAGTEDLNNHSIGIELVNPGRKHGYRAFTAPQMDTLVKLCRDLKARYGIADSNILAHSDIAPARKSDPGELFDWKMLAAAGVGVWPEPDDDDRRVAHHYLRDEKSLREAFTRAGYDPKAELKEVVIAFQRHFYPEAFADQDRDAVGRMDHEAASRLHWLVRHAPGL